MTKSLRTTTGALSRKALAVILALVMTITMVPALAFAENARGGGLS
jgi:hypothetical protein